MPGQPSPSQSSSSSQPQSLKVEFIDETTRQRRTAQIDSSERLTVADLKAQARLLFGYTVEDKQCEEGHGLKLFYPEGGLDEVEVRDERRGGGGASRGPSCARLAGYAGWLRWLATLAGYAG